LLSLSRNTFGVNMHRQLITRSQYLAELNHRLRSHPAYADGMRFLPSGTNDPEAAHGFEWVCDGHDGTTAPPFPFAEIAAEVHALYRVESS